VGLKEKVVFSMAVSMFLMESLVSDSLLGAVETTVLKDFCPRAF
jgi:hypothetical protein